MGIHQTLFFNRGGGQLQWPDGAGVFGVSDVRGDFNQGGTSSCTLTFRSDGLVGMIGNGTIGNSSWTNNIVGIGDGYWIRATLTGSFETGATANRSGTNGTWLHLSSNNSWSLTISGLDVLSGTTYTFEFASDSGGTNIVGTYTECDLNALWQNLV